MVRTVTLAMLVAGMASEGGQTLAQDGRNNLGQDRRQSARHTETDQVTGARLSLAVNQAGHVVTSVSLPDFLVEKVVDAVGHATLRISQGRDTVTVALSQSGYSIKRGNRSASFDPRNPREADVDRIRSVLLGSQAIRAFRRLTAQLENSDDDQSLLVMSTLVDGALVQMLDGDPGATQRIAKRLTRKQRATLRPIAAAPGRPYRDCILLYELSLVYSFDTFEECLETAYNNSWYISSWARTLCEWEFLIRSQQYIYQFGSCVAFPF
jgi:hypothetical protein